MPNRLADASSPYLQQHANNPVEWYPWGDEAIARARAEDKPILLSIGYSACHWCHVMEHESFDDPQTAALMNRLFVSVKVDREERPDLDQIYQLVVQLMRGTGGWPLTVFLTPELRPFFAGTYFPPAPRHGMPDFRTVLEAVDEAYRSRRNEVESTAAELTAAIEQVTRARAEPRDPPADAAIVAAHAMARRFDEQHGGFGDQPKFPNTMALDVLLRAGYRGDAASLGRARRALDGMRAGGIHDHLGGGFHRYSTDARWRVPHFEKMLYDNALLARLYVEGWRVTRDERYAQTARDTLGYVLREMRRPDGLFFSSQDADSEGAEGRFFVWTPGELEAVLGADDARVFALRHGVSAEGNFEDTGASVLHENRDVDVVAQQLGITPDEVEAALTRARAALFAHRETRPKPFRDEKVIAAWNGLMIGAFAEAGAAFGEPRYVHVAVEALRALRATLWSEGALFRIAMDGPPGPLDGKGRVPAFLEDYANVANAALDVHRATLDPEWLGFAIELAEAALARFSDEAEGGFFFAAASDDLIVRAKDAYDNAAPSGSSAIAHALLRLAWLTGEERWREPAERTLRALCAPALESPLGFGHLICALDGYANGAVEVVVVAEPDDPAADALLEATRAEWVPDLVLARVVPGEVARGAAARAVPPELKDGRACATVCRGRTCSLPVTDPAELRALLRP